MPKEVIIKRYQQDHVLGHINVLFNVNNLYGDDRPDDYSEVVNRGNTSGWIDKFHKDDYQQADYQQADYQTLTLDASDLYWMKQACG